MQTGSIPPPRAWPRRYVACHNLPRAWVKWAKFEEKQGQTANSRAVFEAAMQAWLCL